MKNEQSIREMLERLQIVATPEALDDPDCADDEGLQCAYSGVMGRFDKTVQLRLA
jgi:hypothetical protein